ncbi:MAG: carbohydrate kinase family protein [Anaerolineae bacterium]|nr:carbohydrate kinase family protein [Anaerolineae bacterium]
MATKHLCVGSLALNDTVYADGRTSMANPGGNALYAAVGANIWSNQVGIVAVVGYDWPPDYTDTLRQSAINTAGLIKKDHETLRAWIIYESSGYRQYFSRNTEVVLRTPDPFSSTPLTAAEAAAYSDAARRVHLRNSPLPQELPPHLWNIDAIHLCPMRLETLLAWIDYLQDKPDIFVSVDISPHPLNGNLDDPELLKLLSRVDAFMPSEVEAEGLMPGYHIRTFCREIAARGPKIVVVKQGDHGATLYNRNHNLLYQIAPYPVEVNDLTGAGDSFCGGFSVGYLKTGDPLEAIFYGTVSASFVIEGFGGLHALDVNHAQAEERLAKVRQLNKFRP